MLGRLLALLILALPAVASAQVEPYRIQAGDRLEVSVLEDPALNRAVLVRPDGRISLPLAGALEAAGLSPEQLAARLRNRLAAEFIAPPTVTVALIGIGDAPVAGAAGLAAIYVVGEVGAPGRYDVALPLSVLQALALSGGPGVFADRDRIHVRRQSRDASEALFFDYEAVEDGLTPLNDIMLADGDVIVVPERGFFE